jgi:superfamily II DNA or RNA helicase
VRVIAEEVLVSAAGRVVRHLAEPVIGRVGFCDEALRPSGAERVAEAEAELCRIWHPAFRRWLLESGWVEVSEGELRCSPAPRELEDPRCSALREVLGDEITAAVLRGSKVHRFELGQDRVRCSAGRLRVEPQNFRGRALAVMSVMEHADGLVCADAVWLTGAHELGLSVRLSAGVNPVEAVVHLPGGGGETMRAFEAVSVLERVHHDHPVVVDPEVLDVAEMAGAAGIDRPGLHPAQDEVVSVLCATQWGAVLASPPGAGKTVMCAAMLAEASFERVLIAAPVAVLAQWATELSRFAPRCSVRVVQKSHDVTAALRSHDVVVVSHQNAARWAERARREVSCVIVDEAAVLLRRSPQAAGLWRLRELAERGFALTGTPEEHGGGGGTGQLVAWVRRRARGSVPELGPARYEPVVAGVRAGSGVPPVVVDLSAVMPSEVEKSAVAAAVAEEFKGRGLAREQERRRRVEVLARPGSDGRKERAAVERVVAHTASGGSALVCTSSLDAARRVQEALRTHKVRAEVLDSKNRERRLGVLAGFAEGEIPVVVVTPAAQRGVNLQRADLVVHLDLPESYEAFVQRNGRAARFGSVHEKVVAWVPYLAGTADEAWTRQFLDGQCDVLELTAALRR